MAQRGYLLSEATSCDLTGHRLSDLPADVVRQILNQHPRMDFASGFIELIVRDARVKPGCLADLYLRPRQTRSVGGISRSAQRSLTAAPPVSLITDPCLSDDQHRLRDLMSEVA